MLSHSQHWYNFSFLQEHWLELLAPLLQRNFVFFIGGKSWEDWRPPPRKFGYVEGKFGNGRENIYISKWESLVIVIPFKS